MNYPTSDKLYRGFVDPWGDIPPALLPSTDLIVCLEVGMHPHQKFDNVDVIEITSDASHRNDVPGGGDYGSSVYAPSIRAVCDAGPTLQKLVKIGKEKMSANQRSAIASRIAKISAEHDTIARENHERARRDYENGIFDAWSIGYILNNQFSRDMTWVNGSFSPFDALISTVEVDRPGSYFGNPSAHLGITVGMAYGVALAHRKYVDVRNMQSYKVGRISDTSHVVLCTIGDGEAICGNIPSALWTCSHYGIGVVYLILNNACWGCEWPYIEQSPQHWSRDSRDFECLDIDNPRIDFEQLAKAFKVFSKSVTRTEEVEPSLKSAIETARKGAPALLDMRLEKHTGQTPSAVP